MRREGACRLVGEERKGCVEQRMRWAMSTTSSLVASAPTADGLVAAPPLPAPELADDDDDDDCVDCFLRLLLLPL